ncbi:signal peptide peptidase-like 4 [Dioscorea cayenensis subsp. rotundata]|uniref:Signal peptide peptidase-like 4 n=1 Tax=Dioscorea cayennensis subsp. rotundata TaxID=55577 RepID=A0AB40AYF3_DIOCR|nr:signal peptide peptidase-like 4 [Dioscorea cayenensis subsp. rotundata]
MTTEKVATDKHQLSVYPLSHSTSSEEKVGGRGDLDALLCLLVVSRFFMELKGFLGLFLALILVVLLPGFVIGGDIVHEDDEAPKQPNCSNNFVLVKVQTWIDNREDSEFVGVGARFGTPLESQERHANRTRLLIADPPDLCSPPRKKVLLYSPFLVINDIPM